MLSDLLRHQFISHYSITTKGITVDECITDLSDFDLDDMKSPIKVLPFNQGKVSFKGNTEHLGIVHYEDFINQCNKPISFSNGRKRCDYIIYSIDSDNGIGHIFLAELTTATGGTSNLSKAILCNNGNIKYAGGKYEKAEKQLADSLATLLDVPEIKAFFNNRTDKQCIMAYKIESYEDPVLRMRHPMNRYLEIESAETQQSGAVISSPAINSYGFTYRRLSHKAYYQM